MWKESFEILILIGHTKVMSDREKQQVTYLMYFRKWITEQGLQMISQNIFQELR